MADFQKYMHIERYGNDEVQGIELGECYIFPKIDGTNASVWIDNNKIQAGSRNRHLSLEKDNAGFLAYAMSDSNLLKFVSEYGEFRLFGEWLVPHSLKTYREDAWRRFYIFDVVEIETGRYLSYKEYQPIIEEYGLDYIPPICVISNVTYDSLLKQLDKTTFLIKDGEGQGEGIVIKNYQFENRFGRLCFAKIVTNEFKEKNSKAFGPKETLATKMIEWDIADEYITKSLIEKNYAKIANENQGWNSKYIPQLFGRVWYDLITEDSWNFINKFKSPTINFKTLHQVMVLKIKKVMPELF